MECLFSLSYCDVSTIYPFVPATSTATASSYLKAITSPSSCSTLGTCLPTAADAASVSGRRGGFRRWWVGDKLEQH